MFQQNPPIKPPETAATPPVAPAPTPVDRRGSAAEAIEKGRKLPVEERAIKALSMAEKGEQFLRQEDKNWSRVVLGDKTVAEKVVGLKDLFGEDTPMLMVQKRNAENIRAERGKNGHYYVPGTNQRVAIFDGYKVYVPQTETEKNDFEKEAKEERRQNVDRKRRRAETAKKIEKINIAVAQLQTEKIPDDGIFAFKMLVAGGEIADKINGILAADSSINLKKNHRDFIKIHNLLVDRSGAYFSTAYAKELAKINLEKNLEGEALAAYKQRNNPRVRKVIDKMTKKLSVGPESDRFWSYLHERLTDPNNKDSYYEAYAKRFEEQKSDTALAANEKGRKKIGQEKTNIHQLPTHLMEAALVVRETDFNINKPGAKEYIKQCLIAHKETNRKDTYADWLKTANEVRQKEILVAKKDKDKGKRSKT